LKHSSTYRWHVYAGVALLLAGPYAAVAQKLEYQLVDPAIIESRLRRAVDKNPEREKILETLFEEAGCKGEQLVEQPVKGWHTANVICTLKGTDEATIVVGAHYDKVGIGHGVVDNWSGVSLLPSFFQGLQAKPRRLTFVFVGFASEEDGLVGSKFYVDRLSKEQRQAIRAMVNLDSLGLSDTKVWLSRADKNLAAAAFKVARFLNLRLGAVNVDQVGLSDAGSFRERKIPSIDFHSVTQETLPILHSMRDTFSVIRLPEYQNSYTLLAAYLTFLDASAEPVAPQQQLRIMHRPPNL
jgi:Zn-dependent M28 family amino/carboxypeptidase